MNKVFLGLEQLKAKDHGAINLIQNDRISEVEEDDGPARTALVSKASISRIPMPAVYEI